MGVFCDDEMCILKLIEYYQAHLAHVFETVRREGILDFVRKWVHLLDKVLEVGDHLRHGVRVLEYGLGILLIGSVEDILCIQREWIVDLKVDVFELVQVGLLVVYEVPV